MKLISCRKTTAPVGATKLKERNDQRTFIQMLNWKFFCCRIAVTSGYFFAYIMLFDFIFRIPLVKHVNIKWLLLHRRSEKKMKQNIGTCSYRLRIGNSSFNIRTRKTPKTRLGREKIIFLNKSFSVKGSIWFVLLHRNKNVNLLKH